jgi:hypothetical protein
MSKISITPNASGTGVFTISSPATSTNRTLTLPDEAGTIITTAGVPSSAMPVGSVLQVVYASNDTAFSSASDAEVFSGSIVMASASNRLLITCSVLWGATNNGGYLALTDGSNTIINRPTASGSRGRYHWGPLYDINASLYIALRESFTTVITPSVTGTYTVKLRCYVSASATVYVNRDGYNGDRLADPIGISTLTLTEIKG